MHFQGNAILTSKEEFLDVVKNDREETIKELLTLLGSERPLTGPEAREFLQLDITTFQKYVTRKDNPIPHSGKGRMRRFEKRELRDWLKTLRYE